MTELELHEVGRQHLSCLLHVGQKDTVNGSLPGDNCHKPDPTLLLIDWAEPNSLPEKNHAKFQ